MTTLLSPKLRLLIFLFLSLLFLGALSFFSAPRVLAADPAPTPAPGMFPFPGPDRLAPPPMPENPTQADLGAQVYYQVCMVCHGDLGQGLTDEWRGVLDPEDQNCWQSGCHHTKHPPGGFIFPKYVPPVAGQDVLSHYPTALHLHDYIEARMPWQARGTRSEDEYWQLTAFLLHLNGVDPGAEDLNAARAAAIVLNPNLVAPATPAPTPAPAGVIGQVGPHLLWLGLGAGGLILLLGFILLIRRRSFA